MPLGGGGENYELLSIMTHFKSIETLTERLDYILVLLYSLDGESQALFEAEIKKFENILTDIDFMRQVKYRDSLVRDYPTEYYGRDYSQEDPFLFLPDLEKQINEINIEIMAVLGRIIKVMSDSEVHIGDDA